jgi:uncharacterized membrane protein/sporulation protein YlmC with PRC-barrel domain
MRNIPINAKVSCTDGSCGETIAVIIDPITRRVTHFVVEDKTFTKSPQRLVSVEHLEEVKPDSIQLDCSKEQVTGMDPFIKTRFVETQAPVYSKYKSPYSWPYVDSTIESSIVSVEEEQIPAGEEPIFRGDPIYATDGEIGSVGELLIDTSSGTITHIVLREGHLWGLKEITLPVSAIRTVELSGIYLKIDKNAVESMPAVPVRRRYGTQGVHITDLEILIWAFDKVNQADQAEGLLKDLDRLNEIKVVNLAVLIKDKDGQITIRETEDVESKEGTVFGAIVGGVVGLIGGPVGVIIGAAAGALTGRAVAKKVDMGLPESYLQEVQKHIKADSSAIIIVVENHWAQKAIEAVEPVGGKIFRYPLTDDVVSKYIEAVEANEEPT